MPNVYLIPSYLAEEAKDSIPESVLNNLRNCQVIFAEQERTARRYLKSIDPSIVIDDFIWYGIHKAEETVVLDFKKELKAGKNIAIISEAGCPGIADPGQVLIAAAHELNGRIIPLVGPSSIILSLMASGLNGQQFEFVGYLPIDSAERSRKLKELEMNSQKNNSTKIFIETPYRNHQLLESILQHCQPDTRLCIAADLTGKNEFISTKKVSDWKKTKPELHKIPVIFLLHRN